MRYIKTSEPQNFPARLFIRWSLRNGSVPPRNKNFWTLLRFSSSLLLIIISFVLLEATYITCVLNRTSPILVQYLQQNHCRGARINWYVFRGETKLAFRLKDYFLYQLHPFSVHEPKYFNVCFRISVKLTALLIRFQLSSMCESFLTDVHDNLLQITSM